MSTRHDVFQRIYKYTHMKIYLLTLKTPFRIETYDSCVVCAEDEQDAVSITPDGNPIKDGDRSSSWAVRKSDIVCQEIGTANKSQERGLILSSFLGY